MKNNYVWTLAVVALVAIAASAFAQDESSAMTDQAADSGSVYGWQLMDEQERFSYRDHMRSLNTEDERNEFRLSHHEKMQTRAREQGVSLGEPQSRGGDRHNKGSKGGKGGGRSQSNRPAFADFDGNGDGYLEQGEYAKAHAERVVAQTKQGREMKNAGRTTFADIDTDGDGRASPAEFAAHQAQQHQANQRRKQRN